jgi:rare lipoprotein A
MFHGKPTSNGERYDMYGMTAAHPTLPIPSYVRVTRVSTGKTVVLRVNDRGPFLAGRIIDLSYAAAYKLDVVAPGSAEVIVERIMPDEIRNWRGREASQPTLPTPPRQAAPTETPVSTLATQGTIYLQAGAFSEPARAQSLASTVSSQLPASTGATVKIEQGANNLYRVRIGPFSSREAASQAGEQLQNAAGLVTTISAP